MAETIKGINIEFSANMAGVVKNINDLATQSRKTTAELNQINKALKLDPGNVVLLQQKYVVLNQQVEQLRRKEIALQDAVDAVDQQIAQGVEIDAAAYRKLERELENTSRALNASRKVAADMTAQFHGLDTSAEEVAEELEGIQEAAEEAEKGLSETGAATDKLKKILSDALIGKVGIEITKMGVAAIKTAIEFESAFAGVEKTVNGTEAQLAGLRQGIIDMAREIPASREEIAGVAAAAGQLGIATDDILDFTRVMIDLGETTNLTAADAATQLARFANITQMSANDFDRLGSTIVDLGNNLATTEAEIVAMGLRLAGAGEQAGLSENQIMALAGALSSVGIEAEAGGSAMSKFILNLQQTVSAGGKDLATFASVAGYSVENFKKAFELDAATAVDAFVQGLGKLKENGGDAVAALTDLGITEVRQRDALLRLSNAGDLLNESLNLGARAWDENSALANEAAVRYETTAAQLSILKNQVTEILLNLGDGMIPVLKTVLDIASPLAQGVADLAHGFAQLPSGIQGTVFGMAALVAGIKIGVTSVSALKAGLATLNVQAAATGVTLTAALGPLGMVLKTLGILGVVGATAAAVFSTSAAAADDFGQKTNDAKAAIEGAVAAAENQRSELESLSAQMQRTQASILGMEEGSEEYKNAMAQMEVMHKRLIDITGDAQTADELYAAVLTDDAAAIIQAMESLRAAIETQKQDEIQAKIDSAQADIDALETKKENTLLEIEQLEKRMEAWKIYADTISRLGPNADEDGIGAGQRLTAGEEQIKGLTEALTDYDDQIIKSRADMADLKEDVKKLGNTSGVNPDDPDDYGAGVRTAASAKAAAAAQKEITEVERLTHQMELLSDQYKINADEAERAGNQGEALALKTAGVQEQIALQTQIVANAEKALAEASGENEAETMDLEKALSKEQGALNNLENQLTAAEQAQIDFGKAMRTTEKDAQTLKTELDTLYKSLIEDLDNAEKAYKANVIAANTAHSASIAQINADTVRSVEAVNKRLADSERQLTQAFEKEVDSRVRSIRDFAGMFDEVTQKDVSGEQLLKNLKGQLDTLEMWQENLNALRGRLGENELMKELEAMGPSASAEIRALNSLTDEELAEYAAIFKEKNELAKKEAVYQMQDQRQQLGDELKKLREDAAAELDQINLDAAEKLEELNAKHEDELKKLKTEWEKTTQTIRANTEKEAAAIEARLAALSEAASKYGVGFMTAYIAGIRSKKSELDSLLEEIKRATENALGGSGGSSSSTGVGFTPAYQSFAGGNPIRTVEDAAAIAPNLMQSMQEGIVNLQTFGDRAAAAAYADEVEARYASTLRVVSAYAARRERAAASSQETKQTTVNYTQNNYSPKPISAIDAYQAGLDVSRRLARELGR